MSKMKNLFRLGAGLYYGLRNFVHAGEMHATCT